MTNHTSVAAGGASSDTGVADDSMPLPPLTKRLRPADWVALDGVIAVLFAVVFLVGSTRPAYGIPIGVAYLVALIGTVPAAVRRLWPLPVLGVVLAGSVAAQAIGTGKDASVVVAFVLYLVALRYPRRASAPILAGVLVLTAAATVAGGAALGHEQVGAVAARIVASAVVITAAWVIGFAVREQRAYTAGLREQAERQAQAQLEEGRRAVAEERLRIARELHDSLTHSISVICVQAGVAAHLARKRGEEVPSALMAIQEAGADAARELRTTLSVLRTEEDADTSGLSQLARLVARAEGAGLPVTVTVSGGERPLPPEVDQAAYRIVQEALTNIDRHAGGACASVRLHYTAEALSVQVDDDGARAGTGTGIRPTGTGLGLIGMRERVTALGGEFRAGPREGGGFRVHAELRARGPS